MGCPVKVNRPPRAARAGGGNKRVRELSPRPDNCTTCFMETFPSTSMRTPCASSPSPAVRSRPFVGLRPRERRVQGLRLHRLRLHRWR